MAFNFVQNNAVISADFSEIKDEVKEEFYTYFGNNIDLSDSTIAGLFVNLFTLNRAGVLETNLFTANQLNPNLANGKYLDSIMALTNAVTGIRQSATSSIINNVLITGIPETILPAGSIAINSETNTEWQTVEDYQIGSNGEVLATFQSLDKGKITCFANELNKVKLGNIIGWETVNNSESATLGKKTETDGELRRRRNNTLGSQGTATSIAISSALYNIENVRSVYFEENFSVNTKDLGLIQLEPKSIYAVVDGGLEQDIANALFINKSGGCGYNGSIEVIVQDPITNKNNLIKFDTPEEVEVYVRVTIQPTTTSNPEELVKDIISEYAVNELFINDDVRIFSLSAIIENSSDLKILDIETSIDNGLTYNSTNVTINFLQVARINKNNVSLVVV